MAPELLIFNTRDGGEEKDRICLEEFGATKYLEYLPNSFEVLGGNSNYDFFLRAQGRRSYKQFKGLKFKKEWELVTVAMKFDITRTDSYTLKDME